MKKRIEYLYSNLGLKAPEEKGHTYYYALLDFSKIAEKKYSKEFAEDLKKNHLLLEFLFRLAEKYSVICLPGEGFDGPKWSLRVSLANLDDDAYIVVGKALNDLLENYHVEWKKKKS